MSYLKSDNEIAIMAEGGKILASIISEVSLNAREGVSLIQLDRLTAKLIESAGGKPAFLGYRPEGAIRPYPATICASVNNVIVHGMPTEYVIKKGDLVKLDFGLYFKGWCVDAAVTVAIEPVSDIAKKLSAVTKQSLKKAVEAMREGNRLGDVGYAIQNYVEKNGFKVIRGLTGHGIGKRLHEDPSVLNFGTKGKGEILRAGLVLALEPMVAEGTSQIIQLKDESYATADHSLSAHFEHTVAVMKDGPKILTMI
ncbi:MAG: type I methionyl aminopeptidase [Candidatus Liptonbacteria bacterium]|nr:type I methionyl aminopeptidase [Candidatus Liptonbacteria bacterium]